MNNLKDKWLEALRSGEYKQVKNTLKGRTETGEVGYCCLGVFESINGREPQIEVMDEDGYIDEGPLGTYNQLEETIGVHIDKDYLVGMNDRGQSFEDIAYYIDCNWQEVKDALGTSE